MKLLFTHAATMALFLSVCLVSCSGDGTERPAPSQEAAKPAAPTGEAPAADELVEPLLAWAEAEPEDGKAPLTVQFNADIEGGTPPLTIIWTFGDESATSNEPNPSHTYAKPGSYRADLDVKDSAGDSDNDWVEIEVE